MSSSVAQNKTLMQPHGVQSMTKNECLKDEFYSSPWGADASSRSKVIPIFQHTPRRGQF
jgi:hypothetical protein